MNHIFQLYDWYAFDEILENDSDSSDGEEDFDNKIVQKYTICLFGVDQTGKNNTIKVLNFEPYFWIQLPSRWNLTWTHELLESLQNMLPRNMRNEIIINNSSKQVHKKFVFRDYQWGKRRLFLKLSFRSENALRRIYYKIKNKLTIKSIDLYNHAFPVFEKNIQPLLRFIHLKDIKPTGWIEIKNSTKQIDGNFGFSSYDNWTVDWNDVNKIHNKEINDSIGPICIASFDIEADSSHGDFPLAKKNYSKLSNEIIDEYLRLKRNKIQITPIKIKQWLKCSFRDYLSIGEKNKLSEDLKSSFQNVILKTDYTINNELFNKIGTSIYRELTKIKLKKNKEIQESIAKILDETFPAIQGDKIIQIGTVSYKYGFEKSSIKRHIVTLGGCAKIDGIAVVPCNTIEELIKTWVDYINTLQPNIITGYNIFGFDFKFIWECAQECDCTKYLQSLGPINSLNTNLVEKTLSSSALGQNILYYFDSPGIVMIDLMKVIQRDHNLSSYKLDNVSIDFIHGKVTEINIDDINKVIELKTSTTFSLNAGQFIILYELSIIGKEVLIEKSKIKSIEENEKILLEYNDEIIDLLKGVPKNPKNHFWAVGKDNVGPKDIFKLQKGSDLDRSVVAKYCVQDCELCLSLMQKLEIIANNIGMSNVCLVPLAYLFMRGQMIKTLSLVSSECMKENYIIPELQKLDDEIKESYEGAEVLEPNPAIHLHDPISVLDYGSLYPSSMIGTNISHDTIITDKKYLGDEGGKILNELGLFYKDVSYDNYVNILSGKTWKKKVNEDQPIVTCRYIQPPKLNNKIDDTKRGILPKILMKLLKARKDTRNLIKTEKDPFRRSVLDGLQLAYKVTANSLYGGVGASVSALYYKDIAASTTAIGRRHLHLAKSYVNEVYPDADVIYGDSVTFDTPLLVKYKNEIHILSAEDLFEKFQFQKIGPFHTDNTEKTFVSCKNYVVWTEKGWTTIHKIMKHKTNKQIFRVSTNTSCVDVTKDHSMITEFGYPIKPTELRVGEKILTSFPKFSKITSSIKYYDLNDDFIKIIGYFFGKGDCDISGDSVYWKITDDNKTKIKFYLNLCRNILPEFDWKLNSHYGKNNFYTLEMSSEFITSKISFANYFKENLYHSNTNSKKIPIFVLNSNQNVKERFIDGLCDCNKQNLILKGKIATMGVFTVLKMLNHFVSIITHDAKKDTFTVSFSKENIIQHENTISNISKIQYDGEFVYDLCTDNHHFHAGIGQCIVHNTDSIFVNFKPKNNSGGRLVGKEAIQESINMAVKVEEGIQHKLEYPHKLEYEKTFYPFILLRKKGYIGNKYEFDLDQYKQTSMGVVTKRRDNAPIVKYVYDGIIKKIINDRDIQGSIEFLKLTIDKILKGDFPIQYFIITKCLRSEYANPEQIVHKVLADRIAERDSGNKPQSNDRIPYVYIHTKSKQSLQGDRVEHPDFIKEHNLKIDYPFYITNQIQKPVCQVYALSLESLRCHGYKLPHDYFDKLLQKYEDENKKDIREKIMEKKMDAVYDVLFKKIVEIEEGKRFGQRSISDFFEKKNIKN